VLRARTVVTPDALLCPGEVVVEEGRITAVRAGREPDAAHAPRAVYDVLVPGFVDLQVNGVGDIAVATAAGADWDRLERALLGSGTTTWCPTLPTVAPAVLRAALARLEAAAARPAGDGPHLAGVHLEGPFLAVPGAHPPRLLAPRVTAAQLAAIAPVVRVVTLAPELPGALEAIATLARAGVLVALGHSACTAEQAHAAATAGARLVTHLGNAMGPFHHRRPGLLGAALADDRLAVSLIADLVHLHPDVVRIAFLAKGAPRTVLVTDRVAQPTPGGAVGGGRTASGSGRGGGTPAAVELPDGTLAGSLLTPAAAVARCVRSAGISLVAAVAAAATTPARLLGLSDRGALVSGARADIVALRGNPADPAAPEPDVVAVWLSGRRVWPPAVSGSRRRPADTTAR